jgi:hypothetical protein
MTIALKVKHSAAVIADNKAPVLFLMNGMVAPLDDMCDCKGRR